MGTVPILLSVKRFEPNVPASSYRIKEISEEISKEGGV